MDRRQHFMDINSCQLFFVTCSSLPEAINAFDYPLQKRTAAVQQPLLTHL